MSNMLRALVGLALRRAPYAPIQTKFWTRQAITLFAAVVLLLELLSIWFGCGLPMAAVRRVS